jgi:O-antigen/teichoic acid export membrane protein
MKSIDTFQATLVATAIWMSASRFGPIAASIVAALTLTSSDYGLYVVALAWLGGLVSVVSSATQVQFARALEGTETIVGSASRQSGKPDVQILKSSLFTTALVPICTTITLYNSGYPSVIITLIAVAGLFSGINSVLGALLWSENRLHVLSWLACLESALMIVGIYLGGLLVGDLLGSMIGLTCASVLACLSYSLASSFVLAGPLPEIVSPVARPLQSILTPNLLNGVASAAGPALALTACIHRDPSGIPLYGLAMIVIALFLFPVQILGVSITQPLITKRNHERVELGRNSLLVGFIVGVLVAACLVVLGPHVWGLGQLNTWIPQSAAISEIFLLLAGIYFCFSIVVAAGPIVQANRQYWLWAGLNIICALVFVVASWLLPTGPTLIFQACFISAVLRAAIGIPLASCVVQKWSR